MKKILLISGLVFGMVAHAQDYTVDFYTTNPSLVEGDAIIFDGIRVNGFALTPEDAAKAKFVFDSNDFTFKLDLDSVVVYAGVGVFHEQHMVMDVPTDMVQPSYIANLDAKTGKKDAEIVVPVGQALSAGTDYKFTIPAVGTPFVGDFNLSIGHVMSLYFSNASQDIAYQFTGPAGTGLEGEIKAKEKVFTKPIKILLAGDYQLSILPSNPEKDATFSLKTFNANNRAMTLLKDGDKLKESFVANTWDYVKFLVTLESEDTLKAPAVKKLKAADGENWEKTNIKNQTLTLKLVDKASHVVAYADNFSDLVFPHPGVTSQDYCLFIYDQIGGGSKYSGQVEITNPNKPPKESKPPKNPKPPKPDSTQDEPTQDEPTQDEPTQDEPTPENEI